MIMALSQEFKDFAAAYRFNNTTSMPGVAQNNGEAERHVQTVKNLLKKAKDPYLALLVSNKHFCFALN